MVAGVLWVLWPRSAPRGGDEVPVVDLAPRVEALGGRLIVAEGEVVDVLDRLRSAWSFDRLLSRLILSIVGSSRLWSFARLWFLFIQ